MTGSATAQPEPRLTHADQPVRRRRAASTTSGPPESPTQASAGPRRRTDGVVERRLAGAPAQRCGGSTSRTAARRSRSDTCAAGAPVSVSALRRQPPFIEAAEAEHGRRRRIVLARRGFGDQRPGLRLEPDQGDVVVPACAAS